MTQQADGEPLTEDGTLLPCKHLRGLRRLIRQTRQAHLEQGDTHCGYLLWIHWLATLSELARREGRRRVPERIVHTDGTRIVGTTEESNPQPLEENASSDTRKETER
jgi:hypothetical protein